MNKKELIEKFTSRTINTKESDDSEKINETSEVDNSSVKTYSRQFLNTDKKQIIERLFTTEIELEMERRKRMFLEQCFDASPISISSEQGDFVICGNAVWVVEKVLGEKKVLRSGENSITWVPNGYSQKQPSSTPE